VTILVWEEEVGEEEEDSLSSVTSGGKEFLENFIPSWRIPPRFCHTDNVSLCSLFVVTSIREETNKHSDDGIRVVGFVFAVGRGRGTPFAVSACVWWAHHLQGCYHGNLAVWLLLLCLVAPKNPPPELALKKYLPWVLAWRNLCPELLPKETLMQDSWGWMAQGWQLCRGQVCANWMG